MAPRTIKQVLRERQDESGISAQSLLVTAVWMMAAFVSGLSLTSFNSNSAEDSEASPAQPPTKCQPWELQNPGAGSGVGVADVGSETGADAAGCLAPCRSILNNLETNVLQSVNEPGAEPDLNAASRTRLDWPIDWLAAAMSEPAGSGPQRPPEPSGSGPQQLPEPPSGDPQQPPEPASDELLPESLANPEAAAASPTAQLSRIAVKAADQHDGCVIYNTATDEIYFDSRQN